MASAQNASHESDVSPANSSTHGDSVAYREQLRNAAQSESVQDSEARSQVNAGECDPERVAYRERLRRLANGEDADKSRSMSAHAASTCKTNEANAQANTDIAQPDKTHREASARTVQNSSAVGKGAGPEKKVSIGDASALGAREQVPETTTAKADQGTKSEDKPAEAAYADSLRRDSNGEAPRPQYSSSLIAQREMTTERNFVKNLAFDQLHIWESPFKMRDSDATWAVPFGITTGALIATDHDTSKQLAKPSRLNISKQISDAGLFASIGAGAGFYGLGLMTHDEHKRETGLLAGEAFINAALVAEALKYAVGRQRPFEADHFGHIGKGGSSFPSGHAIDTWAAATVIAHEYPNPFVEIGAYGLATTVAATRVTAGQHFPSDVLVGGAFGYLIGRKIYNDHHNPDLGGTEYGTFVREHKSDAEHSGSAYVPLDSWIYPVIDRLSALGFVHSNFDSERPFTRLECARLSAEAEEKAANDDIPADVRSMIDSLRQEFAPESEVWAGNSENRSSQLESVYTRATEIAGPVLRDGFHSGQTLYNDYGRPYGRGFNNVTGFSARATSGPLVLYFRGEYQHAPGNPIYTPQQKALVTSFDFGTPVSDTQFAAADRFQILDAYIGVNFAGNQLTLGQQTLWWGPGTGGSFMFSNNAEPLNMVRLNRVTPLDIPGLSKFLGPMRYEAFLGQTDGHHFVVANNVRYGPHLRTQPFIQGQRLSFKPTPNFEFGFSRTGIFGGDGNPFTLHQLFRATFSTGNTEPGRPGDPGDRRSGVDLTYRIPKLRDWLTFYLDSFSDDEISPLFFPRRSPMRPGIYLAKLPKFGRMDLRVEGVYTDIPSFGALELPGFFYFNGAFLNGYTKNGDLLGSWIGRDGRGVYATSQIWLTSRNTLQIGYREAVADRQFVEGGRYQDEFIKGNFDLSQHLSISAMLQYENWRFRALAPGLQTNVTSSFQFTYRPNNHEGR